MIRRKRIILCNWVATLLCVVTGIADTSGGGGGDEKSEGGGALTPSATLLASTLDGRLVALNKVDGTVMWAMNDEPAVRSRPHDPNVASLFLPDPKTGALYMLGAGGAASAGGGGAGPKSQLKKLPFTIPELVAASPCKSSDGILYTGRKVDTWYSVDRRTGDKRGSISVQGCSRFPDECPNSQSHASSSEFLIGRTEYSVMMYDSKPKASGSSGGGSPMSASQRSWNVTFYDYSANLGSASDVGPDYDMVHFADSSTGNLLTLDRRTGSLLWERRMDSPVVAIYLAQSEGMAAVPFTSVSGETLENLLDRSHQDSVDPMTSQTPPDDVNALNKLYPTLYIGEHKHGLFAMPSLVDKQTLTISPRNSGGPLLLEGPSGGVGADVESIGGGGAPMIEDNSSNSQGGQANDDYSAPSGRSDSRQSNDRTTKFDIPGGIDRAVAEQQILLLGYYKVPDWSQVRLSKSPRLQITAMSPDTDGRDNRHIQNGNGGSGSGGSIGGSLQGEGGRRQQQQLPAPHPADRFLPMPGDSLLPQGYPFIMPDEATAFDNGGTTKTASYNESLIHEGFLAIKNLDFGYIASGRLVRFFGELVPWSSKFLSDLENKELKAIVLLMVILVLTFIQFVRKNTIVPTSSSSHGRGHGVSNSSGVSSGSRPGAYYEVTALPEILDDGHTVKVGNIQFDPNAVLGKGCEGTFVFKGRFDTRDVAVKRVLAACFSIADREVDLLRESDEHPNVVRYFCMEQDTQFRYIALELCAATLQDYVDGSFVCPGLDSLTILRQATLGLAHLHALDICHRDIKPHNVLLSVQATGNASAAGRTAAAAPEVRAMISDFGLCKKLKVGRMSFSRRSGIAGTEGWIAPEMMLGNRSTTCRVDIFSLGCVYYFVMSGGSHPFGESFRRQANILSGESDLSKLKVASRSSSSPSPPVAALPLVSRMLSVDPNQRPPAGAVLRHPLFWSKEKMLHFLQDVSDRVDLEDRDSALVEALEHNRHLVLHGRNWYEELDPVVAEDLRKRRSYNGKSVRDLLRAIRNKKHHYHELPEEVKTRYGRVPDGYAHYWLHRRFPGLVSHAYHAMHRVKHEPSFAKYFHRDYDFLACHRTDDDDEVACLRDASLAAAADSRLDVDFKVQSEWESGGQRRLFMMTTPPPTGSPGCGGDASAFDKNNHSFRQSNQQSGKSSVVSNWEAMLLDEMRSPSPDGSNRQILASGDHTENPTENESPVEERLRDFCDEGAPPLRRTDPETLSLRPPLTTADTGWRGTLGGESQIMSTPAAVEESVAKPAAADPRPLNLTAAPPSDGFDAAADRRSEVADFHDTSGIDQADNKVDHEEFSSDYSNQGSCVNGGLDVESFQDDEDDSFKAFPVGELSSSQDVDALNDAKSLAFSTNTKSERSLKSSDSFDIATAPTSHNLLDATNKCDQETDGEKPVIWIVKKEDEEKKRKKKSKKRKK